MRKARAHAYHLVLSAVTGLGARSAPATGRLTEIPFTQVAPEGSLGVEPDIFGQTGQEVAGPDSTFATVLAELTLSGKNLRDARSRAARVLRAPPRVLPV